MKRTTDDFLMENKGKEMENVARLNWNCKGVKLFLLTDSQVLNPRIKGKQC